MQEYKYLTKFNQPDDGEHDALIRRMPRALADERTAALTRQVRIDKLNPKQQEAYALALEVHGITDDTAYHMALAGYRTIDDFKAIPAISVGQKAAMDHIADFRKPIYRGEVFHHWEVLVECLELVDKAMHVVIAGSYRRGALYCADINVVVVGPPGERAEATIAKVHHSYLPKLQERGYIQAILTKPETTVVPGLAPEWSGAVCLDRYHNIWRRLNLYICSADEAGAALCCFTGTSAFVRGMKLAAQDKGFELTAMGLRKSLGMGEWQYFYCKEKKVFESIGAPTKAPVEMAW